ncbi:glycosyltransferase family 2 protein [Butyrivibrio fibrisolvens]|uniref:glycosyltransferase family 2 protein n=1 Tax=Butyrivibrio fibrisolvens TaxID=831 RepID=UPI00040FB170|nr:glycosyltransferase [Butyrivibrio fibrisolvens]
MNSTDGYKVSVIVPIYNVQEYLNTCIDSILDQTYENLEVVLVDDGSTDSSGRICDEYLDKYTTNMIKVIHNTNQGVSAARNCGIENATGEYIACIDSDDYVSRNYIEDLMSAIIQYGADAAISDYIKTVDDAAITIGQPDSYTVMSNVECLNYSYHGGYNGINCTAWGKIFKKRAYTDNNIRYPDGQIHEDISTTYKLIYYSPKIVYVDSKSYYYRLRNSSIMHESFSIKNLDALNGTSEAIDFYEVNGEPELKRLAINYHIRLMLGLNYKLRHSGTSEDVINRFLKKMREDSDKYLTKGSISEPRRLLFRFVISHPWNFLLKKVGV